MSKHVEIEYRTPTSGHVHTTWESRAIGPGYHVFIEASDPVASLPVGTRLYDFTITSRSPRDPARASLTPLPDVVTRHAHEYVTVKTLKDLQNGRFVLDVEKGPEQVK